MCTRCFAVVASAAPNPALLILWLFTDLITHEFDSFIAPLLGLIFLPFTTIFYVLADDPTVVVTGIGWVFVFLGFLCALSSLPRQRLRRPPHRPRQQHHLCAIGFARKVTIRISNHFLLPSR